tara:strand:+ start:534 stop:731 length:198 start_codon:yes stop_codon:yes gene_type:complete
MAGKQESDNSKAAAKAPDNFDIFIKNNLKNKRNCRQNSPNKKRASLQNSKGSPHTYKGEVCDFTA